MAVIRSLKLGVSSVREHQTEVDATYQFVDSHDGTRLLHLATYGSDSRKSEPKVSQVIQLDRQFALELAAIIAREF
ncbi:hypothetical protein [Arthrobacter glacialis]|uniref:Methionyl-tRNA formyltransferase n=1 Tax=Arthrobacter glacialis TaxID=1664 RepID=A0A2S3ZV16_ARTGL|nr:hypothetical protein [Arthrobacter glacialis]POH73078.1 hypothetical protein CVS27_13035 [Arthrobacter glacialis]